MYSLDEFKIDNKGNFPNWKEKKKWPGFQPVEVLIQVG